MKLVTMIAFENANWYLQTERGNMFTVYAFAFLKFCSIYTCCIEATFNVNVNN